MQMRRRAIGLALATGCAGAVLVAPVAASAKQSTQDLSCDGMTVTIRSNNNNSSQNGGWGSVQIVSGSGHLTPVSFSGNLYDVTTGQTLFQFTSDKGNGHPGSNQQLISCSQQQTGALGDVLQPGDQVPPGASLTDTVTMTFTALAYQRP